MTSYRSIIIFWALFLVPTLIMAAVAFKLLSHEQDRITQSAKDALVERTKTISDTIHLTIEAVQENLVQSLLDLDQNQLEKNLVQWEETNPLVRNVFIYRQDGHLDYPVRGMESTKEERQFIARYDALFSGRIKFDFNKDHLKQEVKKQYISDSDSGSVLYETVPKKVRKKSSRKTLVDLSRMAQMAPEKENAIMLSLEANKRLIKTSDWIPWFSENRLYILGWVQKYETGPVYGVELELMTLLSRLVTDFPKLSQENWAMVLMDGNDNFMHQTGGFAPDIKDIPVSVIPVSLLLPHWRLGVFMDQKGGVANNGFLYLSLILLGIFIVAIVSGGVLLTRMTLRNMKDARQKTSFVSSVSHELKTPLTSIRMYAELLLSKRVADENKTQTYLSVIVDESHRLTRLINNVLDFGRLEQGKKKYQYAAIQMDQFLNHIIQAHSIRIQSLEIEITTQVGEGDYRIRTDKDALEQVVLNLLDNALKYASDGKFINFILEKEEAFILLKICDDGPGIPKAQQEIIFEKFHRVDNTLNAKQPGSGLGLSIARQILQDLGGDLTFEPMPGNGSCFTARIKHHESD